MVYILNSLKLYELTRTSPRNLVLKKDPSTQVSECFGKDSH